MSVEQYWSLRIQRAEEELYRELAENVTHPTHLYQPGSERLERLYDAMAEAQRFSWPMDGYQVNL